MNPTITPQGIAAAVAAAALGGSITITHMALGSEDYSVTTGWSELDIRGRREVAAVSDGADNGDRSFTVSSHFKNSVLVGADYSARVIGFYIGHPDSGGTLFALWSEPGALIANRASAAKADFVGSWTLQLEDVPAGSVTVVVDPSSGFDAQVMRMHTTPELVPHPHQQYVIHTQAQGLTTPQRAQARSNIAAEVSGAGAAAVATHAALPAGAHTPAAVGADPAGSAANAVAAHAALTSGAHTPAAVGAEPAGAVASHLLAAPHLGDAYIIGLVEATIANAIAIESRKNRPIGTVSFTYDSEVPEYAIWADGNEYERDENAELFAWAEAKGLVVPHAQWLANSWTMYSDGNGTTTFRTPRLEDDFVKIVAGGTPPGTWSDYRLPSHSHTGSTDSTGAHRHTVGPWSGEIPGGVDWPSEPWEDNSQPKTTNVTSEAGAHSHSFTTDETGGGPGLWPRHVAMRAFIWK